ncbi:MAG TPA: aspartyl protease family protein [Gemmatimonadaceae bacterium]|nr:aspartyl protease family protein [Gemmatimonadaceae bacterium]
MITQRTFVRASAVVAALAAPLLHAQTRALSYCSAPAARRPSLPAVIPIEIRNNHVTFTVCRGDKKLTFVLDTGAGNSIFDMETAKSMGVVLGAPGRANGGGAGTVPMAQVPHDSVYIPGISLTVPISTAIDFRSITGPEGSTLEGILGADFIARYIVALDYRNSEMRLYDRNAFTYSGSGTTVPFTLRGAFIFVSAELGLADGARVPGTFVVDVGSSLPLALAKPFVEANNLRSRVGPTVHRPSGRGVGGTSVADIGRVETLNLGGVEIKRPIAHLYGDSAGVFSSSNLGDGNIGADILRRYTVYLDYRARTMILEPHAGTAEPFEADMSGVQLVAAGGPRLTVEFVLPASPAGEAGLMKGDTVVAIDGEPVSSATLEPFRKRMRTANERVAITIRRDGTERVLAFVTRRLV